MRERLTMDGDCGTVFAVLGRCQLPWTAQPLGASKGEAGAAGPSCIMPTPAVDVNTAAMPRRGEVCSLSVT